MAADLFCRIQKESTGAEVYSVLISNRLGSLQLASHSREGMSSTRNCHLRFVALLEQQFGSRWFETARYM